MTSTHSGFDMEILDVLPSFFEKGDQEVDGHVEILSDLLFIEIFSSDGRAHAEDFLKLKPDCALNFINFVLHVFSFAHHNWELVNLIQRVTE